MVLLAVSLQLLAARGQPPSNEGSAKTWIGRNQEFEEYLKTAECMSPEPLSSARAMRCVLRPGGPIARMAWRSPGLNPGFHERYKNDVAAYEVDKLLKLDMVPPSVLRQLNGAEGAAQQWIESVVAVRGDEPPQARYKAEWDNQLVRVTMFDNLIGNKDRNLGNMIRDARWNLFLLDHSRAFGVDSDLPNRMARIDDALWKRIEGLTQKQLDTALRELIDEDPIRAILDRRERMRGQIKQPAR